MERKKILVVDDERDLCEIMLFNLTAAGYEAEAAHSAEEAMQRDLPAFDLLLLDVMMPGMSGFDMARRLKCDERTASLPVIFLTAKDAEDDTLQGFDIGADDYVTKPFSVREVLARVRAVLNRAVPQAAGKEECLHYGQLQIDPLRKTVSADGEEVALTKTEFDLLHWLMSHREEVFSRQQLLNSVWPKDVIVTDRTVDVNITRLRKKIGRYAANIVARQGFGYCFTDEVKPAQRNHDETE